MAYASLVSLTNTLDENIQLNLISQNSPYIQTLLREANFFQDFLEKSSNRSSETAKYLESQIRDAAYKAQDIIDSHVANRFDVSEEPEVDWDACLFKDLDEVMEEINSIKLEAMQIGEEGKEEVEDNDETDLQPRILQPARSSRPSHGMTTMVGLDDHLKEIKTRLVSGSSQRDIVALVGMGGIGKTTLAQKIYNEESILSHFDICGWATVSQEHNVQNILLGLLDSMRSLTDELRREPKEKLAEVLYKSLKRKRYFIVLDDMWDTQVWDYLKRILTNDENGSRILLTTRLKKVAEYENNCPPHHVRFLNDEESWGLFCENVFGKDGCPPGLEKVGNEIVANCRGLPLAIKVIGGHLSKNPRIESYWRSVTKNLSEKIALEDDERCSRVLSLSYKHLPHRMKSCFLYMSIFPEDCEIEVSRLVHLWVASGLIKQERFKSCEDIAKECFLDFVERNLILVSECKYNRKIIGCKIHDLIRDLCVKEAKSERSFPITDKTLFCNRNFHDHMDDVLYSRHLRAFCFDGRNTDRGPTAINHQPHMRSLFLYTNFQMHYNTESFHKLQHLHTIHISHCSRTLNIWEMPQLRHVKVHRNLTLPDPPSKIEGGNSVIVLEKLQTLKTTHNLVFTDDVLQRIPNIKKLGIIYAEKKDGATNWKDFGLNNLERLHKLESLQLFFHKTPVLLNRDITFPHCIKKLTLGHCNSPWEEMTVVGSLPNLEVLRLEDASFIGEAWKTNEGEFRNLKTLLLWWVDDLVHWRVEADHFPVLQHLMIINCEELQEIPRDIGEIPTLELLQLYGCGDSVYSSAKEIEEEQHSFGNESFQFVYEYYEG